MVDSVSLTNALQPLDAREERHGQAAVHEAVVHDDVGQTERRHPRTCANSHRRENSMHIASDHHERSGDRRVRDGERIIQLEAALPTSMVGAMDAPERSMPYASVEEARPWLHRGRDEQRDARTDDEARECRHEEAS